MPKIKAIVFDFDGVLAESVNIKNEAFRELFKGHPKHLDSIIQLHLVHGGLSRFKKFEMIYKSILKRKISKNKMRTLGRLFSKYVVDKVVACPLVEGTLDFLRRYSKIVDLFIISGTPQREIRAIVKRKSLAKYFRDILGSPRCKDELVSYLMKKYALDSQDIIFIGDSIEDLEAARHNGLYFIGRCHGPNSLKKYLPLKQRIRDINGLQDILKENYL